MEKGVQVCVKFGKILKRNSFSQTDLSCFGNKDAETVWRRKKQLRQK